jgi:hypothetical protein
MGPTANRKPTRPNRLTRAITACAPTPAGSGRLPEAGSANDFLDESDVDGHDKIVGIVGGGFGYELENPPTTSRTKKTKPNAEVRTPSTRNRQSGRHFWRAQPIHFSCQSIEHQICFLFSIGYEVRSEIMKRRQKVPDLKPTQFAVGMLEIDEKIDLVCRYSRKQLRDFVNENPVPIVVGPVGDLYIVDHHHFLSVCYHLGIEKVRIKVVRDLSKRQMTYSQFWKRMFKTRNTYPFCQFGEGPRKAIYLPKDVRGLADDPYRSLAWFVRKCGGFKNSERNFAEFKWANFFRGRGLLDRFGPASMSKALVKAAKLAQSPAAKHLPGYGKLKLDEHVQVVKKLKEKGRELKSRSAS